MTGTPARLLVTGRLRDEIATALGRALPDVPVAYAGREEAGPWPAVEAWLVGTPAQELPRWNAGATPRLRFVQRLFTGLDEFPFAAFPPEVAVAGNVGAFAPFVAEHAVALLLALAHDLAANDAKVRAGTLRPIQGNRYLAGRTVLLLGYGAIARATADRLRPFGVRLRALTRRGEPVADVERTYGPAQLADAAADADVVVECRPLTRKTRATLDRTVLGRMKPDAILINIGRAGTIAEGDLYAHLASHPDFRAGLDVWWEEDYEQGTLGTSYPFRELPNLLGTPHVAAIGSAAREQAIEAAVTNLARFFRGGTPAHVADRSDYLPPDADA